MTPFHRQLLEMLAQEGPIPVDRFMARALSHYYATRDPLGAAGDFTTAPEISQMFGELIGLWAAHCNALIGAPASVALVELGPGRGTLMADALRASARAAPAFRAALAVHLVETSPALRSKQADRLGPAVADWHETIDTLPTGPLIVVANEFFDALPVRQFVRTGQGWRERMVGVESGRLAFGLSAEPAADGPSHDLPLGTIIERSEAALAVFGALIARIASNGGAILAIDYGSLEGGVGDTLQALRGQTMVHPLDHVGDADLTTHVDFSPLIRIAEAAGLTIDFAGSQADFLIALGIESRAQTLRRQATAEQQSAIDAALSRLTDRSSTGMGSLFKVLAVRKPVALG